MQNRQGLAGRGSKTIKAKATLDTEEFKSIEYRTNSQRNANERSLSGLGLVRSQSNKIINDPQAFRNALLAQMKAEKEGKK